MSQSLLARAQALLHSKPGALALSILPIATLAARPTRVQASVLFSFTDIGIMDTTTVPPSGPINHLADQSISSSSLPNGGVHLVGTVGTLKNSNLSISAGGTNFYGGYGGTYSGAFDVHVEGLLSGTINSGDVLTAAVLLNFLPSSGTTSFIDMRLSSSLGLNGLDPVSGPFVGSFADTVSTSPAGFSGVVDGNTWSLDIRFFWDGILDANNDTLLVTIPNNSIDVYAGQQAPEPTSAFLLFPVFLLLTRRKWNAFPAVSIQRSADYTARAGTHSTDLMTA